ncbi:hypothetical protein P4C99_02915 [Pontiellaceae bacterium B1224]|nr:hypothetical protein [Pontiellaceae bacterium B1224]
MRIPSAILIVLASALLTLSAFSDATRESKFVGGTDFSTLCAESDLIAVVNILAVHSTNGVEIAEASVEQMIKGDQNLTNIFFLASSTWTCDISGGEQGETALVFLSKIEDRSKVQTEWCNTIF